MTLTDVPAGFIATVVTHLEMTEKPRLAAIEKSIAKNAKLEKWQEPKTEAYRELFRAVGEEWLWVSRLLLSDEELCTIIRDPQIDIYRILFDDGAIGLLELDFRIRTQCEISFFGLKPAFTGKGLGRWLMQSALRLAWRDNVQRVWLHTCTLDSPYAISFYEKSGFTAYARQIEMFRDPRITGHLPKSVGSHIPLIS